jgi:hypothetical protein
MYFLPETFGALDYGTVVGKRDVTCCKDMYSVPKRKFDEFSELAYLLKPDLQMPEDADSALNLFLELND